MTNRIREHREAAGLSQAELADRLGTTFQQVSRLERGARGLDDKWLTKLSAALGLPKADFLIDHSVTPELREVAQDGHEIRLLRAWRGLSNEERDGLLLLFEKLSAPSGGELDNVVGKHRRRSHNS